MQYFQAFNFRKRIFDCELCFVGSLHVEVWAIRVMKFVFCFVCQYWYRLKFSLICVFACFRQHRLYWFWIESVLWIQVLWPHWKVSSISYLLLIFFQYSYKESLIVHIFKQLDYVMQVQIRPDRRHHKLSNLVLLWYFHEIETDWERSGY